MAAGAMRPRQQRLRQAPKRVRQNADRDIIKGTELLLGKNRIHRAVKNKPSGLEAQQPRGIDGRQITVVHGHEHAGPGGATAFQQIKKSGHAGHVQP